MRGMLTQKQMTQFEDLLLLMGVPDKEMSEITAALMETRKCNLFLNKLSAKNYEMSPEEVYQAALDTMDETAAIRGLFPDCPIQI